MFRFLIAVLLGACTLTGSAVAQDARGGDPCFFSRDYRGFRAINEHSFYIRTRISDIYRIDTDGACPQLAQPDARLITVVHGSDEICGPLDWQLQVATAADPPVACVVKRQTRLSPQQAATIPSRLRP